MKEKLTTFFDLQKLGTNIRTELIAGISSFLAVSYIIIINPAILAASGMPFSGALTATVLVCFFSSLMMGIYAKNPIIVAPGMGLNAFFTFTVVVGMHIPWTTALGAVFLSGIIFILLSIFNIRTWIVEAIPKPLRYAVSGGIGVFIAFIGLVNAKFIVSNPATLIGMGKMTPMVISFLAGFLFTIVLVLKKVKSAILLGIIFTTTLSYPIGRWWGGHETLIQWKGALALPDFSLVGKLDILGACRFALWPVIFSFVFTDMFDSLSSLIGLCEAAQLVDKKGEPLHLKKSLTTDGISTTIAGLLGSSPGTAYVESAVGISAGGKSGLTAVVAAILFLPFLFFSPLLSMVPTIATAPSLVLVGALMISAVTKIHWSQLEEAIPCFLAFILIPFTYSITQGIIWGFLSWTICKIAVGKRKEISITLIAIDVLAIIALSFHE